jgi:DNA-binding NarL/FixJ family response regulator
VVASATDIALLVVDDDAIVRAWVRAALAGSEFRIAGEAGRAVEAIALVERRRPDLLLVDQLLPDWTGTELVRELRRRWPPLRCLVISAYSGSQYEQEAQLAGADGFLHKDDPTRLPEAMQAVLRGETYFSRDGQLRVGPPDGRDLAGS